jgi:hypothetical protein
MNFIEVSVECLMSTHCAKLDQNDIMRMDGGEWAMGRSSGKFPEVRAHMKTVDESLFSSLYEAQAIEAYHT